MCDLRGLLHRKARHVGANLVFAPPWANTRFAPTALRAHCHYNAGSVRARILHFAFPRVQLGSRAKRSRGESRIRPSLGEHKVHPCLAARTLLMLNAETLQKLQFSGQPRGVWIGGRQAGQHQETQRLPDAVRAPAFLIGIEHAHQGIGRVGQV